MSYRSNAAEAWYPDPQPAAPAEIPLDLLPPASLTQPLWRSLVGNLRDTFAPAKLPPLATDFASGRMWAGAWRRLRMPWFRTVFTNIGDVLSPETLPPLELESRPVDVGELITDQLSHFWWGSLLRNLADRVAPERMPTLNLTAKPMLDIIPKSWMLLPAVVGSRGHAEGVLSRQAKDGRDGGRFNLQTSCCAGREARGSGR